MFQIKLTNFRCFAEAPPVEVRPITFLVGENSAGKTTFMAAARVLFEGFSRTAQNPFNREPYYLGGFDQIAHYRGGKAGRARKFSLELTSLPQVGETSTATGRARSASGTMKHLFTFVKGSPQPELTEYGFSTPEAEIRIVLEKEPTVRIYRSGIEVFVYKPKGSPPSRILRKDWSYVRFLIQELSYPHSVEMGAIQDDDIRQLLKRLFEDFMQSHRYVNRSVFASAPVRTQPLRTYTPSEITGSAEGAHVPVEMARQKLDSPSSWSGVHDKLARFGAESGLFEDIEIRQLGKRDGDPFQLMVKTGGPPMNIVDVGYGVSQVLPIIYQLEQTGEYGVFLLQQPEVHLHPKAQAELGTLISRLSKRRAAPMYVIETHSDYIIDRVRMEVASGKLDPKTVSIVFFDRRGHDVEPINLYLDEKGEILNAPDNYRAFFLEEQQRLLGL